MIALVWALWVGISLFFCTYSAIYIIMLIYTLPLDPHSG